MSADGVGYIAAAALVLAAAPVVIAGATAVGVIWGAAKLVSFAASSITKSELARREHERKRVVETARKDSEERRLIKGLVSELDSVREGGERTKKELNDRFAAEMSALASEAKRAGAADDAALVKLEADLTRRSEALVSSWKSSLDKLDEDYTSKVNSAVSRMRTTVSKGAAEIARLRAESAPDDRIKSFALEQIDRAKTAISAFKIETDGNSLISESQLRKAEDYFKHGYYENAYNTASAVTLDCYTEMAKAMAEREKILSLIDKSEVRALLLEGRLESLKSFSFDYKGTSYEEDLTRFEPMLFKGISRRLSEVKAKLDSKDPVTLKLASATMDELESDIREAVDLAAKKLLFAYMENDTAEEVSDAMAEQGFEMEDYAYAGDCEGNALHINFHNRVSKERITVVLTPDGSRLKVDVHNYGTADSPMADPTRQRDIRELIERALKTNITCSRIGQNSVKTEAADMRKVKAT